MTNNCSSTIETASIAREILEGTGYAIVPNVLSAQQAREARSRVLQLAQTDRQAGRIRPDSGRERIYGLIYAGEIFETMIQHPVVLQVVETLLGREAVLGGFSAHILHHRASSMGIHVDYPYWAMEPPFPPYPTLEVQAIWLVEDFTEDNGAPVFAPGTQTLCTAPDPDKFARIAEKVTGSAGSVVLSHGLCWHDTSVNATETPRVSILGNYTPKFVQSLEDLNYRGDRAIVDRATPQLKHLLRHAWKAGDRPMFEL